MIVLHGLSVSLIEHIKTLYLLPSGATGLPVLFFELGMGLSQIELQTNLARCRYPGSEMLEST